jgi:uncharacterized membrane protein YidH (DUF202 family)
VSFLRTAFSTTGSKEPSSIRLLFGAVIITMLAPVWVQTIRLAATGDWIPMDGQAIAYAGIMSGMVTALLAYARAQESKEMQQQQQPASSPPPQS